VDDANMASALCEAAKGGYTDVLSMWLQQPNVDVNAQTHHKTTPLLVASEHGELECVQQLLAVDGINLDAMDDDGDTALSCAANKGHVTIVALLIKNGANVNAVGVLGPTAQVDKVC
jgi:ankyrin repeat protein